MNPRRPVEESGLKLEPQSGSFLFMPPSLMAQGGDQLHRAGPSVPRFRQVQADPAEDEQSRARVSFRSLMEGELASFVPKTARRCAPCSRSQRQTPLKVAWSTVKSADPA